LLLNVVALSNLRILFQ